MNEPHLSLAILSRGRLPSLRRAVNSAVAHAGAPIFVVVLFDDDIEGYESYDPPGDNVKKVLLRPRHYYVRAINQAYDILKSTGSDVIGFGNNDAEWIKPGWAVAAKEALWKEFPDGMGILEMSGEEQKLAHFVTRTPFVEEELGGRIMAPAYTQYYADRELLNRVEGELGRYAHILYTDGSRPGWIIQHNEWDSVSADGRRWFAQDQAEYVLRTPGAKLLTKED